MLWGFDFGYDYPSYNFGFDYWGYFPIYDLLSASEAVVNQFDYYAKFYTKVFFYLFTRFFLLSWDKEMDLNKRSGTKLWSCLTVYLYTVYHQGLNLKVSRLDNNLCKTLSYLQCPWILQMFECGDFYKNNYLNGGNAYILDKSRLGFEWIYEKAWRAVLNREMEKRKRERIMLTQVKLFENTKTS